MYVISQINIWQVLFVFLGWLDEIDPNIYHDEIGHDIFTTIWVSFCPFNLTIPGRQGVSFTDLNGTQHTVSLPDSNVG